MQPEEEAIEPSGWLSEKEWKFVQRKLPIACVDIVPIRPGDGATPHVGLIQRTSPFDDGLRWCQIGGRIRRDETVRTSLLRHLHGTLEGVHVLLPSDPQPDYVMQWFPTPPAEQDGVAYGADPRRHAVALSFVVELLGDPVRVEGGEAHRFEWFTYADVAALGDMLWPGTEALLGALLPRTKS